MFYNAGKEQMMGKITIFLKMINDKQQQSHFIVRT